MSLATKNTEGAKLIPLDGGASPPLMFSSGSLFSSLACRPSGLNPFVPSVARLFCGSRRDRGTVLLVALCFVAVMGIVLGSYLAVCTRAMQLSNRGFQANLSKQLAEAGIDEALRAFNKNDWSGWTSSGTSVVWDTTTYAADKRAVATMTFPTTKFGQGVTAEVKIRVDNSDAHVLGATWINTVTYRINDLIAYNGIWYRSLRDNNTGNQPADSSQNPNLTWWVPAPIPWMWSSDNPYAQYDLMNYNGVWFRHYAANSTTNTAPALDTDGANSSYWGPIPTMRTWASGISYTLHDVVFVNSGDVVGPYRCTTAHTSAGSFATDASNWSSNVQAVSLAWTSSPVYTRGAIVCYNGAWYYCRTSGSSATAPDSDTTMWAPFLTAAGAVANPAADTFAVGVRYYEGDYVYRNSNSTWYRCISSHTYAAGDISLASLWVTTSNTGIPRISWAYRNSGANGAFRFNDVVYYGAGSQQWYRCVETTTGTINTVPTTTADWEPALSGDNTSSSPGALGWSSSSINYSVGDVVYYYASSTSRWFRCIRAHTSSTSLTPTNTTYWTGTPHFSTEWQPNHQYGAYDTVRYKGMWFLSLQNSNTGNQPMAANSTWWAAAPREIPAWNSATAYNFDDLVSHSNTWYRCIQPHASQTPSSSSSYWTVLTGSGTSYVWNDTTSYAASSYRSYGGVWYKCLVSTSGQTPNNKDYWAPTWKQSWQDVGDAAGAPVVYAEAEIALGDGTTSKTQLRASIHPASPFPNALAATNLLTISGGAIGTIDSYDGSVRAINTGGTYDTYDYNSENNTPFDSTTNPNIGFSAVVAAKGSSSPSLTIGTSTTVKGFAAANSAATSPFAPLISYGSSASMKNEDNTVTSPHPTVNNVDLARVGRSPYIPDFDIQDGAPGTALSTTTAVSAILGTPGGVAPSVYQVSGSVTLNGAAEILYITGPVVLRITTNLRVNTFTTARINITPTGSLRLIVKRDFRLESSGGGIKNQTSDPKKLVIYCTRVGADTFEISNPSSTNNFIGTLSMPDATSAMTVATNTQIFGALSAQSISFSGAANVHYDTSLRYATFTGVDQPYTVTNWRELTATEQATMP